MTTIGCCRPRRRSAASSPETRPRGTKPDATTNHRNGTSEKRVLTDDGAIAVEVPRDRAGTFEPQLIPKHARRLAALSHRTSGAVHSEGAFDSVLQALFTPHFPRPFTPYFERPSRRTSSAVHSELPARFTPHFKRCSCRTSRAVHSELPAHFTPHLKRFSSPRTPPPRCLSSSRRSNAGRHLPRRRG